MRVSFRPVRFAAEQPKPAPKPADLPPAAPQSPASATPPASGQSQPPVLTPDEEAVLRELKWRTA